MLLYLDKKAWLPERKEIKNLKLEDVEKPILQESKKVILNKTEHQYDISKETKVSRIDSENKNLFKGVVALSIMLIIILFIFYIIEGALNGIADALGNIPKWLLIPLFVGGILFFNGAFNKDEDK